MSFDESQQDFYLDHDHIGRIGANKTVVPKILIPLISISYMQFHYYRDMVSLSQAKMVGNLNTSQTTQPWQILGQSWAVHRIKFVANDLYICWK